MAWTLVADGNVAVVLFSMWCVWLSWIDVVSRRLPNALTGIGAVSLLAYSYAIDAALAALSGAVLLSCCYLAVHLCLPAAFGAGDVKLAFTLGGVAALAGTDAWVAAALIAPLLTGAAGIALMATGRGNATVPHGPSMCAATLLASAVVPT
ncbi:A24 family peptidase [Rhodococcus sovatensis]|uniref:A24 family peptidase n=1 Tax=Rhodococcus sovatensis TaxID=1805840 RepID=A0ABZ2PNT2_9NOCA